MANGGEEGEGVSLEWVLGTNFCSYARTYSDVGMSGCCDLFLSPGMTPQLIFRRGLVGVAFAALATPYANDLMCALARGLTSFPISPFPLLSLSITAQQLKC
ncbi:hypothetical protein ACLKA6_014061 [Drosophila palustris]